MTERKNPSLYADIPALLAEKPFHYGHSQDELDELNLRLAGYKGMGKRSFVDRVKAKPVFMSIMLDFDRATPKSLRMMELQGFIPGHEHGRSELEEMLALNAKTQRDVRKADNATQQQAALPLNGATPDASTESSEALHLRSDLQFDTIRREIQMRREAVQPMRPRIMKDDEVLRGIEPEPYDLYIPFARAFAASIEKDRVHPDNKHALARLKNINALGSEVQAFLILYDFAESIEKFRRKVEAKAVDARRDVGEFWKEHRQELWPYLKKIKQKYNDRMRELPEKPIVTAGKEGFSTSLTYKAWTEIEKAIEEPEFFVRLKQPRDVMYHLAMEFFVGGEENKGEEHYRAPRTSRSSRGKPTESTKNWEAPERERRHKLLSRIENAYQDDLALVEEMKAAHDPKRADTIDTNRRMPTTTIFHNPFDANLHTLCRVYEGRWAALADEVLDQSRAKLLSDPGIYPGAVTAAERQQAESVQRQLQRAQEKAARDAARAAAIAAREAADAELHGGQVMKRAQLAKLRRNAARKASASEVLEVGIPHAGKPVAETNKPATEIPATNVMGGRALATLKRRATAAKAGMRGNEPVGFFIDGDSSHVAALLKEPTKNDNDKARGGG